MLTSPKTIFDAKSNKIRLIWIVKIIGTECLGNSHLAILVPTDAATQQKNGD